MSSPKTFAAMLMAGIDGIKNKIHPGESFDKDLYELPPEEVKSNFHNSFTPDGFFWGQQFQEQSVKEYKAQDLMFLKFCKQAIKDGKTVVYTCSW